MDFATLTLGADTRQLKGAVTDLRAVTKAGAETEKQTDRTGKAVTVLGAKAATASTANKGLAGSAIAAGRGIDVTGAAAARASVGMHTMAGAAGALVGRLAVIAGAALGIGAVTREIAAFDTAMSAVAAVTRATGADLEALRDTAKDLGATTEFSAAQAADGLKFLGMAGFGARDAIAAIPDVLDLATAAQMDLASAADISSNIMSGFGIAAAQAGDVADVLAAASSRANTDVSQLGQAMSTVAPISATLGISLEDTAAAIGVMSDAGIQGERAGTAMRGMLASLAGPTTAARDALATMGLTIADVDPATRSLADILDTLRGTGMTAAQAMTIFGREAASGALVLVDGAARVREFGDELTNVDGEARRMADTMRDNLGGDIKGLMSAVSGLIITMGEAGLTSVLRGAVQGATDLTRLISGNLVPAFQAAGVVVAGLAATQLPAAISGMYAFAASGGVATGALGLFTAAVNVARAATIALGGPLGLIWGLIGAGAAAWLVFGDNTSTADAAMREAKAGTDALNAALGVFYTTASPEAAASAIDLANANYQLAESAMAAAEAELAKKQALVDFATGSGQGQATMWSMEGTFSPEVAAAQADLDRARGLLDEANRARNRTARAVTGTTSPRFRPSTPSVADLNLPDLTITDVGGGSSRGGGSAAAASGMTDMARAADAARDALANLHQEHADLAATIGMTAEQERIYHAVQELGTGATAAQVAEVQRLIPEIDRLKGAKDRMAQAAQAGKQALENLFGSVIDGSMSAKDAVMQLLAQIARVQIMNGIFAMPGMGGVASSLGGLLTPSFSGGGYTGNAPRSGGLDGEGGFAAILHPRETVVDHSKGGGGAANITYAPTYHVGDGVSRESFDMLRAEMARDKQLFTQEVQRAIRNPRG